MKANELMIWDLINGFGVVRRVTGIHGLERPEDDGLLTTMVPGCEFPESNLSFRPCYAQPIPLTAEILEKNFEKKTLYGIFDDYFDFEIREFNDSMYIVNYHCCEMPIPDTQISNICFVHELQHALRLCGVEKEIIL